MGSGFRPATDARWMRVALRAARVAGRRGEVPVGAVVVLADDRWWAAGNASIATHDASGHAEVRALRRAGRGERNYRLSGATLYTTVEPCVMCAGAALHARISRIVFGCVDVKAGGAGSVFDIPGDPRLNHRTVVVGGVEEAACSALVHEFFRERRRR